MTTLSTAMQRRRVAARGFTLIEVLVAMSVMAVMAAMAWKGVDGISRARASSEEHVERVQRLNTVLAQLELDITSVEDSRILPLRDAGIECDGSNLRLTRHAETGLQLIVWSIHGGVLTRWAAPPAISVQTLQESYLRSLQLLGNESNQLRALPGLSDWQLYFYRVNGWSNCQSSGDLATVAPIVTPADAAASAAASAVTTVQRMQLPKGVRVVLNFAEGSGMSGNLTRDIRVTP